MSLVNFIILLSILHYGHSLTVTLEDLENWKKLMKAELKQEIFLEIHKVMKSNEEIITVVQSHGNKLDSFQEFRENFQETGTQIESLSSLVENHLNLLTDIVAKQNETEVTIQSQSVELNEQKNYLDNFNDTVIEFTKTVNDLDLNSRIDELEVNQTKFQATINTNFSQMNDKIDGVIENQSGIPDMITDCSSQVTGMETDINDLKYNQTEILVIIKNQINDLENSFSGLGVNQTEELQQTLGVSL